MDSFMFFRFYFLRFPRTYFPFTASLFLPLVHLFGRQSLAFHHPLVLIYLLFTLFLSLSIIYIAFVSHCPFFISMTEVSLLSYIFPSSFFSSLFCRLSIVSSSARNILFQRPLLSNCVTFIYTFFLWHCIVISKYWPLHSFLFPFLSFSFFS